MDHQTNIPQTEGQIRTLLHKYPLDETLAFANQMQLRRIAIVYSIAILIFVFLGISAARRGVTPLIAVGGVVIIGVIAAVSIMLSSAKLKKFLNQYKDLERFYAFDQDALWIASTGGQFAKKIPWDTIYTTYSTEKALLICASYNSFVYVPWSTIPDEKDQASLKQLLADKGKAGTFSLLGTFKQ